MRLSFCAIVVTFAVAASGWSFAQSDCVDLGPTSDLICRSDVVLMVKGSGLGGGRTVRLSCDGHLQVSRWSSSRKDYDLEFQTKVDPGEALGLFNRLFALGFWNMPDVYESSFTELIPKDDQYVEARSTVTCDAGTTEIEVSLRDFRHKVVV